MRYLLSNAAPRGQRAMELLRRGYQLVDSGLPLSETNSEDGAVTDLPLRLIH